MGFSLAACIAGMCLGVSTLTGTVVDAAGAPIPNAQVFVEPGLAAPVQQTTAGADGAFRFEDLGTGDTGVFAYAPGHAFGGHHLNIAVEDNPPPLTIRLGEEDQITGRVIGGKDTAIEGAIVTRVAILGADKVAIPLSKLKDYGIPAPSSGKDGSFTVPNLPKGGSVALKFASAQFAAEALDNVAVGEKNLKVQLYLGVLVEGDVVARDGKPVANAPVFLRNAQPPHDTTISASDTRGRFSVRLKPGVYLYQGGGATIQSSGWTKLTLTGEQATTNLRVAVAGTGTIRGQVKDAKTSQPIAGARVALTTNGNRAAVDRTGPTGIYQFTAGAGENVVRLELAQGYQPPAGGSAVKLSLQEGQTVELPGMWLAPIPGYKVQVVDDAMNGVPGAVVRLLQPSQFGLYATGPDGWLELNVGSLPEGGAVIGLAESLDGTKGALFRLTTRDAAGAKVQLLPLARAEGQVNAGRGKALPGAIVSAAFPGTEKDAEPVLLWKTLSNASGAYSWPGVLAGVPQLVIARAVNDKSTASEPFNLAPQETKRLAALEISGARAADSALGKAIDLAALSHACGPALADAAKTVAVFCSADEAAMTAEALDQMLKRLATPGVQACVVAASPPDFANAPVPVLVGKAPSAATTFVLDAAHTVTLETFGLPPIFALH